MKCRVHTNAAGVPSISMQRRSHNSFICQLFDTMVREQRRRNVPDVFFITAHDGDVCTGGVICATEYCDERAAVRVDLVCVNTPRQGYGSMLLQALENFAIDNGIYELKAICVESSVHFFASRGWRRGFNDKYHHKHLPPPPKT